MEGRMKNNKVIMLMKKGDDRRLIEGECRWKIVKAMLENLDYISGGANKV